MRVTHEFVGRQHNALLAFLAGKTRVSPHAEQQSLDDLGAAAMVQCAAAGGNAQKELKKNGVSKS